MKKRLSTSKILLIILGVLLAAIVAAVCVVLSKYNGIVRPADHSEFMGGTIDPSGEIDANPLDDSGVHVQLISGSVDDKFEFKCSILRSGGRYDYIDRMTDSDFYLYRTGMYNGEEEAESSAEFEVFIFVRGSINGDSCFAYRLEDDGSLVKLDKTFDPQTDEICVTVNRFGHIVVVNDEIISSEPPASPTPIITPTPQVTGTPEPTPTITPTPQVTDTPEPTPTITPTPQVTDTPEPTPTITPPPIFPSAAPTPPVQELDLPFTTPDFNNSGVTNILLIGVDATGESFSGRSDVMMIVSLNSKTKKITLTSIMRDLRVELPGKGISTKINAAYAHGGADLLMKTITKRFGIPIDYYVAVNFNGAASLAEMLGGVEMTITDWEAKYMKDPNITKGGTYHFDGKQTLKYMRLRGNGNDWYRTRRQGKVLTYLFNKYTSSSLLDIIRIANEALNYVRTNIPVDVMVSLIRKAYESKDSGIQHDTYPFEPNGRASIPGSSDIKEKSYPTQINKLYERLYDFKPTWK